MDRWPGGARFDKGKIPRYDSFKRRVEEAVVVDDPECDAELLVRWNQEVLEEIFRHKWIESEKAGHDIGLTDAAFDWLDKHYDDWCLSRDYLKIFAEHGLIKDN
jgi:hypothetical protein